MEGDPSIKWQVLSDLSRGEAENIHLQRLHIEMEGIGRKLLDFQGENGLWDESIMINKWKSTIWVLNAFRRLGVYPLDNFILPCQHLIDNSLSFTGGIIYEGTEETHICISGLVLAVCCYFRYLDPKIEAIFHYLIETQSSDGSWVCPHHDNPREFRFLTTLSVLEGLKEYQKIYHFHDSFIRQMQYEAHEFLLNHNLINTEPNGTEKIQGVFRFPFPYFHYDILTTLDYLRNVNFAWDPRLKEALDELKSKVADYKYNVDENVKGTQYVNLDRLEGSRFNTLRMMRVLKHWKQL